MCYYLDFGLVIKSVNVGTDTSLSLHFESQSNHLEGVDLAAASLEFITQIG